MASSPSLPPNAAPDAIRSVAIVGGGTAGWMAATLLSKLFGPALSITLIESDEIGTVGVGEATIPQIKLYNQAIALDEDAFLRATHGTLKLGIQFENWGRLGDSYLHAFGDIGMPLGSLSFHQHWLAHRHGGGSRDLWSFSLNDRAARADKAGRVGPLAGGRLGGLAYAFHFDASLYARYLRSLAEAAGVRRVEGRIEGHARDGLTGNLTHVRLAGGQEVAADLYIDCSGFRGLLIAQALGEGYQDWSEWLPANRAWAVPTARVRAPRPYTRAIARSHGWQWQIPLQHRTGNGHVFSDRFISEDEARAELLANLEGEPLAEPRLISFTTGRRTAFWSHNVVALGLASGFLEPLESTSIHLIQAGLARLVEMWPTRAFNALEVAEYNRAMGMEFERIRDFLVLHYTQTEREDTAFWRHCRAMARPETLTSRLALWDAAGRVYRYPEDLFHEPGWVQVLVGQRRLPHGHHPLAASLPADRREQFFDDITAIQARAVDAMGTHAEFLTGARAAG